MRTVLALALLVSLEACAHRRLADGVRGNPNHDEDWGDAGDAEAAAGNTGAALAAYQRALELDPTDAEWQRKVAATGGPEVFRAAIDAALPSIEWDDERLGDRGDAFVEAGQRDEGCALYRRALAVDAGDTEWSRKVEECDGGTADESVAEGVIGGVVGGVYDEVVYAPEVYDGGYGVLGVLGAGAEGVGGLGYSGIGALTSLYEEPPYDVVSDPGAAAAALEHARGGRTVEARNALWVALLANPWATELRAMWTMLTGESSVTLLAKLTEAQPEDASLWGDLGDAQLAAGRRADAITSWQKAAALAPYDVAWSNRLEMAKTTGKR